MDTSFIDSTPLFNPLLSESDDVENDDAENKAETADKRPKRYNAEARRKVEEYFEKKHLEQLTMDLFLDQG